jgi:hypothetical protein
MLRVIFDLKLELFGSPYQALDNVETFVSHTGHVTVGQAGHAGQGI